MLASPDSDSRFGSLSSRLPWLLALLASASALTWLLFARQQAPVPRKAITVLAVGGTKMAIGNADGRVALLDSNPATTPLEIQKQGQPLNDLRFDTEGRTLFIASRDVWSWEDGALVRLTRDLRNYGCIRFSPKGDRVFWTTGNGDIEAFDRAKRKLLWRNCCSTIYGDIAISPTGEELASAGHEPRLWRSSDGQMLRALLPYDAAFTFRPIVYTTHPSKSESQLWIGSQDGSLRELLHLGDAAKAASARDSVPTLPHYVDSIVQLAGGWLAYGAAGHPIWIYHPQDGQRAALSDAIPSSNFAATATGSLVFGTDRGEVEVWRVDPPLRTSRFSAWPAEASTAR